MSIIIFLIILLVLVLVHEAGHFFTAKKFGIRVDEFGFGFPPKLFGFKKGETEYSLNLLPIGGFVKIFGENPDEESMNGPDASRSFVNKPKWQQAIVLFAGVFMNFLLAWLLFSFGFMSGLPASVNSQSQNYPLTDVHLVVVSVRADSPASLAGLQSGDKIVSFNDPEALKSFIATHSKEEIKIEYLRGQDNNIRVAEIIPTINESGVPMVGIAMDQIGTVKLPFFRAFWEGLKLALGTAKGMVVGLYGLIASSLQGQGRFDSLSGPVGMVGIVDDASKFGFVYLMSFAALISVNLAIINLLPFPALDGGRLFFLLIEKIKGSRINPNVANMTNMIGFGILILLMLVVTYNDVLKLF